MHRSGLFRRLSSLIFSQGLRIFTACDFLPFRFRAADRVPGSEEVVTHATIDPEKDVVPELITFTGSTSAWNTRNTCLWLPFMEDQLWSPLVS